MSDKPTEMPEWATNNTAAEVTEPGTTLKQTGAVKNTQTGAQHINWILHRIYLWLVWFNVGILQRSSLTDNTPIFQTCDRDARPRHYLDPNGYWMGCAIQETHRWTEIDSSGFLANQDDVSPMMRVFVETNALAIVVSGDDVSVDNVTTGDPKLVMRVNDASVNERVVVFPRTGVPSSPSGDMPISDLGNVVAVMEGRVAFDSTAPTGVVWQWGFHEMADFTNANIIQGTANTFVGFKVNGSSSGDFLYVAGNGTTGEDGACTVAVTIAANTLYTLRVEHHGANTPLGVDNSSAPVARLFVDGVLVKEYTGSYGMTTGNVGPVVFGRSSATGPAADTVMTISPIKCAWNGALDFDVPA